MVVKPSYFHNCFMNENPYEKFSPISFKEVKAKTTELANRIRGNRDQLIDILLEYESFEVVEDEIERTLDLLDHIDENKKYFNLRIGGVTAFMPRNQPLYAFSCFVFIPSLMATDVHFRIPEAMSFFFHKVLDLLEIQELAPNIFVSKKERQDFLRERTAMYCDPGSGEEMPVTEAVIFTGTPKHADQLRLVFDNKTLFITNGSGHNPIVVSKNANKDRAVEATLKLTLYNQGQDCAAPNSIIVIDELYDDFMSKLITEIKKVKVGHYNDRTCNIGPISNAKDLVRVKDFLVDNKQYMNPETPGRINTLESILEPTIIEKPLDDGPNYNEIFAPVIFVQKYKKDSDLKKYFANKKYAMNAMYVTLFGDSDYVMKLPKIRINNRRIHSKETIIRNTHLHAPGIERGTQTYGGYGYGASNISLNGKIEPKPTLPQRDIFENLVRPLKENPRELKKQKSIYPKLKAIVEKNIDKLLRIGLTEDTNGSSEKIPENIYIDKTLITLAENRYIKVDKKTLCLLQDKPNKKQISKMSQKELDNISRLKILIKNKHKYTENDFKEKLYEIPKNPEFSDKENKKAQKTFFKNIYKLLFNKDNGPRLNLFLYQTESEKVLELLNV